MIIFLFPVTYIFLLTFGKENALRFRLFPASVSVPVDVNLSENRKSLKEMNFPLSIYITMKLEHRIQKITYKMELE